MAQKMPDEDTYTAKQIATRIGTDAKTLRKFFRSAHSTVTPVGFGGRYEFDKDDLPKIKQEFDGWKSNASKRGRPRVAPVIEESDDSVEIDDIDEELEELDDEEPTDDEINDLDDLVGDVEDFINDPEYWNTGGDN